MPIYQFECESQLCHNEFDYLFMPGEEVFTPACPKCGCPARKVMTASAWNRITGYSERNGYGLHIPNHPREWERPADGYREER